MVKLNDFERELLTILNEPAKSTALDSIENKTGINIRDHDQFKKLEEAILHLIDLGFIRKEKQRDWQGTSLIYITATGKAAINQDDK